MINFTDVYKSFGPKKVLEGFSLEVPDGETTVVIGYSGTGKSVQFGVDNRFCRLLTLDSR